MTTRDTTIKVPKVLRDRIAAQAQHEHVTLATVIADALDAAEERTFWRTVREENSSLSAEERDQYLASVSSADLADADDDALSAEGAW